MNIGKNIRELRIKNNLTQKDLADKLYVTAQAVSRWEQDTVEPNIDTINNMAKIFNVSVDTILGNPETKQTVVQQVVVDPSSIKRTIGVCRDCNKPILEGEIIHHVHSGRGNSHGYDLCDDCEKKKIENAHKHMLATNVKRRKQALVWGIIAGVVILAIFIVCACLQKDAGTIIGFIAAGIVLGYGSFALVYVDIMQNVFVSTIFFDLVGVGFVKMPGIIFSLDIDGFLFLILTKIFLGIVAI